LNELGILRKDGGGRELLCIVVNNWNVNLDEGQRDNLHTFVDGTNTRLLSMRRDRGIVCGCILGSPGKRTEFSIEMKFWRYHQRRGYLLTYGAVCVCFLGISDIFEQIRLRSGVSIGGYEVV